jgi:8-oxo-dGTP diphosphatase
MSRPLHTLVVSVLVRDAEQRLLMIKHPHRGWELPQGHVEQGEDLITAAGREVLEESGYEIEIERLLAVFTKLSPEPSSVIFGFLARPAGGEATTSAESLEIGWFDEAIARDLPEHPVNRARLQRLLDSGSGIDYSSYRMSPFEWVHSQSV